MKTISVAGCWLSRNLMFHDRIADRNEMPRLQVRAIRRRAGRANAMLDHLTRDRPLGKIAHGSASLHRRVKFLRPRNQLIVAVINRGLFIQIIGDAVRIVGSFGLCALSSTKNHQSLVVLQSNCLPK
jgi:hypothetical protein